MGITLLILACLGTDNCRVLPIANNFVHEKQCEAYRPLMVAGWLALNPKATVERYICTSNPEYIIGAWQA